MAEGAELFKLVRTVISNDATLENLSCTHLGDSTPFTPNFY